MKHPMLSTLAGLCAVYLSAATTSGGVLRGPIVNPANGHTYYLLTQNTWTASEAEAVALGGHLATVNDAAENAWITTTFSAPYYYLWIGLNDAAVDGHFAWSSGEPVTYQNWYSGEPNNYNGGEDYVLIYNFDSGYMEWNDDKNVEYFDVFPIYGVVEIGTSVDVTGVRASQRPGTTLVDVSYDFSGTGSGYAISITISSDGGTSFTVPATHFTGDGVTIPAAPGTGRHILWDAGADFPGQFSTKMQLKVAVGSAYAVSPIFTLDTRAVTIIASPHSQSLSSGANATFIVEATGMLPLNYQWRKNGVNIVGATSSTLTLNSVRITDSAGYSVVVWNAAGSAVSAMASLAVLTDGANGSQPTQLSTPTPAAKPPAQDSLVIVTHGWQPIFNSPLGPPPIPSWVTTLSDAIGARVPDNWSVNPYDWTQTAWGPSPDVAIIFGKIVGTLYGQQLAKQHWQHVHLIGHSAGSAVIEAIAHALQSAPNPPTIHSTFLDPYTGIVLSGRVEYGKNADWADCYFAHDDLTTVFTEGRLDQAYNVNVTWADPDKTLTPIYCAAPSSPDSTPMMEVPCGQHASSSHDWPLMFYFATVLGAQQPGCTAGYGFPCSKEGGGWSSRGSRAAGNDPLNLCGPPPPTKNPIPLRFDSLFRFDLLTSATSGSGIIFLGSSGFMLGSSSAQPLVRANGGGTRQRKDNYTMPGTPAWLAVGVTISNAVNLVQFDAGFTDTNAAQGLLTVYWNTNLIGMVDERTASPGLQNYSFSLPGTITEGIYTLSFRLDSFSPAASSITVTNVATGFVGLTQPITLAMLLPPSNTPPVLQLTAPANYNYLIQSSTNLTNWTPAALLVNTNGTVLFADPAATNFSKRFYRATMP